MRIEITNNVIVNGIRTIAFLIIMIVVISCNNRPDDVTLAVIPTPTKVEQQAGVFRLKPDCKIFTDDFEKIEYALDFFDSYVEKSIGYQLARTNRENEAQIIIRNVTDKTLGDEGYHLNISKDGIEIQSAGTRGVYYAFQSIVKLFPVGFEVEGSSVKAELPAVAITDVPEFKYRGMMLDVGRYYFPVDFVKEFIDYTARYKMNVFHWHLTEDQGWRLATEKYPELTEVGAWRDSTITSRKNEPAVYDGKPYGGFYTKEEIREIIDYATKNFVEVIPEIEMPGHAQAALATYPELGCTGGPYRVKTEWGVSEQVYCAGKESTFEFLENVLDEVMELFPSRYIHIGGDECKKDSWEMCENCQKRIKTNNLKNEKELQSYFIQRIEKYLNSKGKQIIGWDEILEGGLAEDATVMVWRGLEPAIKTARQKHNVILSPTQAFYLDYSQGIAADEELIPKNYISLERIYNFNPILDELTPEEQKYIIGVQGNLWTEYVPTGEKAQYQLMPRMAAIAETAWRGSDKNDLEQFIKVLELELIRLGNLGVNHAIITNDDNYDEIQQSHKDFYANRLKTRNLELIPCEYFETSDGKKGLKATYFSDKKLSVIHGRRIDQQINIHNEYPHDSLLIQGDKSARWEAYLIAPKSGTITLATTSDDGIRIWLDDKLIIESWRAQGNTLFERIVEIEKGKKYKLKVEWYDGGGGFVCKLLWNTE